MKILLKILLSIALCALSTTMFATDAPITLSVNSSTGSFTSSNSTGTYHSVWTSTETDPQLTISCGANNFGPYSDDHLVYSSGLNSSSTITLTTSNGWRISAYSFNASLISGNTNTDITYSANGAEAVTITDSIQTISATVAENEIASIVVTGANAGVVLSDFTVTIDIAPAPTYLTTTITNGEFDEETPWYTLQIAEAGYYLHYTGDGQILQLNQIVTTLEDADLWCFVGDNTDGYRIYNKAAGPGKCLASPTDVESAGNSGGNTYATVRAEGLDDYIYEWLPTTSTKLTDIEGAFLAPKGHESWRLNNRINMLSFWTSDADKGSTMQILLSKITVLIDPSTGTMADPSKTWNQTWNRTKEPVVSFGTSKNNMEIINDHIGIATGLSTGVWAFTPPSGMSVNAYEFDYAKATANWTATNVLTLGTEDAINISADSESGHAKIDKLKSSDANTFTYTGTNGLILELSNFKATFIREESEHLGTIVFRYDGSADYNVVYRIPAIATIGEGANKGRILAVNDYRYCGADIGNGRIDLHQSYSDNNGETWTEPDLMRDAEGNAVSEGDGEGTVATSLENDDCGFGDPAIVSDRETGKVLLMSVCGRTPFFSATRSNPNQVARWYSEDGGTTWTQYENITEKIYSLFDDTVPYGSVDAMFFGSGKICQSRQVKVGKYYRLYAVMSGRNVAAGNLSNWILYSDDFGENWAILGDPMTPPVPASADEPKAEELPDGSVLLAARSNGGNRNFNIFHYTDIENAKGTWDTHVNTNCGAGFTINACNGEIMILPVKDNATNEQCYLALQSLPYSSSRTHVSILYKAIKTGSDILEPSCFTTWNGRFQVTNISSCYSTMCWQQDNTLGFIYEESTFGRAFCEVYRNLTIEDITKNKYSYQVDENNAKANALRDELVTLRTAAFPEAGEYVGQYTTDGVQSVKQADASYKANANRDSYVAYNLAQSTAETIKIKKNGLYRIMSAQNVYSDAGDRYLTCDTLNLKSTTVDDESNYFALLQRDDSENWILYHPATQRYVSASPAMSNLFTVTDEVGSAKEYNIVSASNGYSYLACAEDATAIGYPAIHMNAAFNIVSWNISGPASQWYLELKGEAEEVPNLVNEDSVREIIIDSADTPVRYFDLFGRPVAVPKRGNIYITSDHKKVVF